MGLSLKLLGEFAVHDGSGAALSLPTRKTRALLGYLAVHADRPQQRDRLMVLLWSSFGEKQARHNLSQTLLSIRKLGNEAGITLLDGDGERVVLRGEAIDIDLARFRALLDEEPAQAAALYDGPFLDGLAIPDPSFEDWLVTARAELHGLACDALARAADAGDAANAIEFMRRLIALDPLREDAHRRLMGRLHDTGDRAAALRQYQTCADILKKELQVEPDAATKALYEEIKNDTSLSNALKTPRPAPVIPPTETPPPLPDKPSIAVLPFANLSGDPEQEYFADGITEEIITALARLPGFLVIARNSTFIYKGKRIEVQRVADELGVRYVVEGSVRTSGGKVRITAQLIDASTSNHVWAETFDGDLEDVFAVQDEVTHKIVNSIGAELTLAETERLTSHPPKDLMSWQCVIQGSAHFYQFTKASFAKCEEMAHKAIALDDQNAEGYALLAIVQWAQAVAGFVRPGREVMAEATNAAEQAIALNERSARAHAAMGITLITQFRYDEALAESERAVELEPGSAEILTWNGFVLAYTGPHELAVERLRHAVRLNPRDPGMYSRYQALSIASFALGRYEESLESASRVARQLPEWHEACTFVLASLGQLGRTEEAAPVLEETLLRWPHYTVQYAARRHPYRDMEARGRLAEGLRRAGVPD